MLIVDTHAERQYRLLDTVNSPADLRDLSGLEQPVRDYLARMAERPHVQRVNADRKTSTAEMLARQPKR